MKLFRKLFGLNSKDDQLTNKEKLFKEDLINQMHAPTEELFIDNSAFEKSDAQDINNNDEIKSFLERDFFETGLRDGFSLHSNEAAETKKRAIKAEFRNILSRLTSQNNKEILLLRNSLVEVAELSQELKEKLENKIEFLISLSQEYNRQMELSSLDEGQVMSAIHSYNQGFLSGIKSFMEMENLIQTS